MEGTSWLVSRRKRNRDIRDFVSVHGRVVKPESLSERVPSARLAPSNGEAETIERGGEERRRQAQFPEERKESESKRKKIPVSMVSKGVRRKAPPTDIQENSVSTDEGGNSEVTCTARDTKRIRMDSTESPPVQTTVAETPVRHPAASRDTPSPCDVNHHHPPLPWQPEHQCHDDNLVKNHPPLPWQPEHQCHDDNLVKNHPPLPWQPEHQCHDDDVMKNHPPLPWQPEHQCHDDNTMKNHPPLPWQHQSHDIIPPTPTNSKPSEDLQECSSPCLFDESPSSPTRSPVGSPCPPVSSWDTEALLAELETCERLCDELLAL